MVNRAIPWRLSSVLVLAALAAAAAALCDLTDWRLGVRWRAWGASALLLGLALTAVAATSRFRLAAAVALAIPLAMRWNLRRREETGPYGMGLPRCLALSAIVAVGMVPVAIAEARRLHVEMRTKYADRTAVYHWIASSCPVGSIFVVPPDWEDFRLFARRALIADWWAPPPAWQFTDVIEWDRRLADLSAVERPRTLAELERGYAALDCGRLRQLRERYHVGFVVLPMGRTLDCGKGVHGDAHYTVFTVD